MRRLRPRHPRRSRAGKCPPTLSCLRDLPSPSLGPHAELIRAPGQLVSCLDQIVRCGPARRGDDSEAEEDDFISGSSGGEAEEEEMASGSDNDGSQAGVAESDGEQENVPPNVPPNAPSLPKARHAVAAGAGEPAPPGDAKSSLGVTLISLWVTLRARWVTLRARCVTLRARWVTHRARWVTLRAFAM